MSTRSPRRSRRAASIAALVALAAMGLLFLLVPPAYADTTTVGTSAEAWFAAPSCTAAGLCVPPGTVPPLPVDPGVVPPVDPGATPPPATPLSAGTLHVARAGGVEQARAYVKLDLDALPAGATPTGGTLILPVSADQTAGTVNADMAHIQACFMVIPFPAGAFGSVEETPAPDCATSATATLVTLPEGSSFVVDLAAFAERWAAGEPNEGIALIPAVQDPPPPPVPAPVPPVPAPSDETWHVAFNGRDSNAATKISASVTYTLPGIEPLPPAPVPPLVVPGVPGYSIPPPQQPVVQPPPAAVPPQVPVVMVATRGFEYAGVFVLPLLALAIGWAVSYSLTREIEA